MICTGCNVDKPEDDFYLRSNGYRVPKCKACTYAIAKVRLQSPEGKAVTKRAKKKYNASEKGRAKNKAYRESPKGRESGQKGKKRFKRDNPGIQTKYKKRYKDRHPEKAAAKKAVRSMVRYGDFQKPTVCEDCGKTFPVAQIHAHHEDYSKPLDVVWVCPGGHVARHH